MRKYCLLVVACCWTLLAATQSVHYQFSAPNAVHHEAEIQVTAKGLPAGNAIFKMSRSSPGRYATHEFGKNIYHLKAIDANGKAIPLQRMGADVYSIANHGGEVTVQYTLFANHADGTYAAIDKTGFHLNMPATFMWVKGLEKAPITLDIQLPDSSWQVATQLFSGSRKHLFTAPNLQYFMDAPLKAGQLRWRQWEANHRAGKPTTIRIAFDTEATEAQLDAMAQKVKKISAEAAAVFGEYPDFDNGYYTFIASLNPYVQGDGMEHRNSTIITLPVPAADIEYALSTFSHEFFHAWNVERIRPKTLEPFNFEQSNVSDGLWLAEGFTQYYGELLLLRAGLETQEGWLSTLERFIQTKQQQPGGRLFSVINNSEQAVFTDAGSAIDKNNFINTHSSYYITGAATALALELELRNHFGKTLDHFMQTLWQQHGKTGTPYTMADLQHALALTTGDTTHAASFFTHYVHDSKPYDYTTGLQALGIASVNRAKGKPWVGNTRLEAKDGRLRLMGPTIVGSPLYEAQLDMGHEILAIDGVAMTNMTEYNTWLKGKKPGDKVMVVSLYRGLRSEHPLTIGQRSDVNLAVAEQATATATAQRMAWWGSQQ